MGGGQGVTSILLTRGAQAAYVQYREECAARHTVKQLKAQFHADIANLVASPAVKALPDDQKREFVKAAVCARATQLAVQMQHAFQPAVSMGDTLMSSTAAAQTWATDQSPDLLRLSPEPPRLDQHLIEGHLTTAASSTERRTSERRRETLSPTRDFAAPPARKQFAASSS